MGRALSLYRAGPAKTRNDVASPTPIYSPGCRCVKPVIVVQVQVSSHGPRAVAQSMQQVCAVHVSRQNISGNRCIGRMKQMAAYSEGGPKGVVVSFHVTFVVVVGFWMFPIGVTFFLSFLCSCGPSRVDTYLVLFVLFVFLWPMRSCLCDPPLVTLAVLSSVESFVDLAIFRGDRTAQQQQALEGLGRVISMVAGLRFLFSVICGQIRTTLCVNSAGFGSSTFLGCATSSRVDASTVFHGVSQE